MDQGPKFFLTIILVFIGVFLLLGIVTFQAASNNASDAAYAIVQYIEINGYDPEGEAQIIEEYARDRNLIVNITEEPETGIYGSGERYRYRVDVTFRHIFAVIKLDKSLTYTVYTRAISY